MDMQAAADNVVSTLVGWWRERRAAQTGLMEIASLGPDDFVGVAADCGLSSAQLIAIVRAGPHAAEEMGEMLRALNVDESAVMAGDRNLYNDMQAVCAVCGSKGECRRHLRDGTAAETYPSFCGNADTINQLRASPDMLHD